MYVRAWCLHVITWRHDVTKITTWRQETNCFHPSLQICSRADSIMFLWFRWWLNSTWLLSSYLHDGILSQNDVMTLLNMLYLSQIVDVLARRFFFCFYNILGWQVQKYHKCCVCICGYVIKWRYDIMAWLYDVTKLTPSILACGLTRQMTHCPCIHGCLDHSIREGHSICTGMMTSLYAVTSWSWHL